MNLPRPATIQGYLLKHVNKIKLLTLNRYPKRYFLLDVDQSELIVKTEKVMPNRVCQRIPFRDLLTVSMVRYEPLIDGNAKWVYVFTLLTLSRHFRLYCATEQDRRMWVESLASVIALKQMRQVINF